MTYDLKTNDLVSNPVPELLSLRGASVASEQKVALAANSVHHVEKTAGGAAASADIEVNFTVPQVCISEVRFDLITSKGRFELAPNPACLPACLAQLQGGGQLGACVLAVAPGGKPFVPHWEVLPDTNAGYAMVGVPGNKSTFIGNASSAGG